MNLLEQTIEKIVPIDKHAMHLSQKRWDSLYFGSGSLGQLEEMVIHYCGITGEVLPPLPKCAMVVACADHGVAAQHVSAYPQSTTVGMTKGYCIAKGASANAMAKYAGADLTVVDMGINADMSGVPNLLNRKIAYGTQDISQGPAMTKEQAVETIEAGIEIAQEKANAGYRVFTIGEMGISNTTSSASMIAAFNHWNAIEATGRGTNISDERLKHKIEVVQEALDVNHPDSRDGLDVFSKLGGFEFGCLIGVILGAAANHCVTIIDGFNSTACAYVAHSLAPLSKQYMLGSHLSMEQAHKKALQELGLDENINLNLRLGEATGASIQKRMLDIALSIYTESATKEEAGEAK